MSEANSRDFEELLRAQEKLEGNLLRLLDVKDAAHREVTATEIKAIREAIKVADASARDSNAIAREAVQTALRVLDQRLEMTNEWRKEYSEKVEAVLAPIREELAMMRGKADQHTVDRVQLFTLLSIAVGIAALIISVIK